MQELPKYVLKHKRLGKKKLVFIFKRNYLNIRDFKKVDHDWVFEEEFSYHGMKCHFTMIVHDDDIYSMYKADCKIFKVRGKHNCFGIYLRDEQQNPTFHIDREHENVEFILLGEGKSILFDDGSGIYNTRKKRRSKKRRKTTSDRYETRTAVDISKYLSWNATHPLQGGGVSPR